MDNLNDITDDQLKEAYMKYLSLTDELAASHNVIALAGIMVAISLRLYKTFLSPQDYDQLVQTMFQTSQTVEEYDFSQPTMQ